MPDQAPSNPAATKTRTPRGRKAGAPSPGETLRSTQRKRRAELIRAVLAMREKVDQLDSSSSAVVAAALGVRGFTETVVALFDGASLVDGRKALAALAAITQADQDEALVFAIELAEQTGLLKLAWGALAAAGASLPAAPPESLARAAVALKRGVGGLDETGRAALGAALAVAG